MPPAPSSVNAVYVNASSDSALKPGEKIADLYHLNVAGPYLLQKLTANAYFLPA
ncbi:MAG: hypothetical protein ABI036_13670 [Fibrobacteria bacterium]